MEYFFIAFIFFSFAVMHSWSVGQNRLPIKEEERNFKYLFYILVFLIALGVGLRGDNEYTRFYNYTVYLKDFFTSANIAAITQGPVFALIMSTFRTLGLSSQYLLLFFAFSSIFIHALFFRKYTNYYFLAFLIYLSHEMIFKELSTIRAGFASALVLPVIYYIYRNERVKYWSLILIGGLTQYVGFLSALLIFLNRRFSSKILVILLLGSVATYYLDISTLFLDSLNSAGVLPALIADYLSYDLYVYDAGLGNFKLVQQTLVILFLIYIFGNQDMANRLPYYDILFNTYFLSTILLIVFAPLALFAFRFGGHFYSVEPILLTYILYNYSNQKILSLLGCFISLSLAFLNYVLLQKLESYKFLVDDYRIFLGF